MRNIKATLNFQMNVVLKIATTPEILYGKYLVKTKRTTVTPKDVRCV